MPTVEIQPANEGDPLALFTHYNGEHEPQPCYVRLSLEDGALYAGYSGEVGSPRAMPESVWNRRTLEWAIPCLTAQAANELLAELAPLAQQVLDGAEVEWDGHNHVGRLNPEAVDASGRIGKRCDPNGDNFHRSELVEEMDASGWFVYTNDPLADLGLTADTTDEELAAKAKEATEEAMTIAEGPTVLTGVYEHLKRLQDETRG